MQALQVAAAVGLATLLFLIKSRRNYLQLPALPVHSGPPPEDFMVVIPARNEEKNIGRAVSSFSGLPVLVVDDDSSDRTVEIARSAGAAVIPAPAWKPGLMGKPNACQAGAHASDSRWILFVDADTYYTAEFVPSLIHYAETENLVAASVFLRQERVTLFERMLLPYAFALYFCGVDARQANNPRSPEALANGQCLLFRRDAYQFIGGHKAVSGSVIEDVALAQLLKRHRMQARILRAENMGAVRMYDGFGAIWRGFQKNSFRFLLVNPWSGIQVVLASILLTSYVPVLAWLWTEQQWIGAAIFAILPGLVLWPWYGGLEALLLAPFAVYCFQLIALNGMATTIFGRKAIWKGRRV